MTHSPWRVVRESQQKSSLLPLDRKRTVLPYRQEEDTGDSKVVIAIPLPANGAGAACDATQEDDQPNGIFYPGLNLEGRCRHILG